MERGGAVYTKSESALAAAERGDSGFRQSKNKPTAQSACRGYPEQTQDTKHHRSLAVAARI